MRFYEVFLSLRYLKDRKRQKFISFISILSILGVAIGVCTLIVVLSVMNGFDQMLVDKFIGMDAHLSIEKFGEPLNENECNRVLQDFPQIQSWSPQLFGQAMIVGDSFSRGILVKGVDWSKELKTSNISEHLLIKKLKKQNLSDNDILIGKPFAQEKGIFLGEKLELISPMSFLQKKKRLISKDFYVANIFDTKMDEFDANHVYISSNSFRKLFLKREGDVDFIHILLQSNDLLSQVQSGLKSCLKPPIYVYSWYDKNKNLFSALKLEKNAMFIILLLIIIVSVFNISSTLIMIIMEKTKEIGILKSLGAQSVSIAFIFSLQGVITGSIGAVFGLAGGLSICSILKKTDWIRLPSDVYYIDHLPVILNQSDIILITVAAIFLSWISSLYPAIFASRLHPVEAMAS